MSSPQIIRARGTAAEAASIPSASAAAKEPLVMVLFGATGDLSGRKILPALFALWKGKFLPPQMAIVGVAIEKFSDDQFRDLARKSIDEHCRCKPDDDDEWKQFAALLSYQTVDFGSSDSFNTLAGRITSLESKNKLPGNRLFYLAIAPSFFAPVIDQLHGHGLMHRYTPKPPWYRVVIEKPFGRDLATAKALDADIHHFLLEDQIYRIDHYLGKETVLNMMAFR